MIKLTKSGRPAGFAQDVFAFNDLTSWNKVVLSWVSVTLVIVVCCLYYALFGQAKLKDLDLQEQLQSQKVAEFGRKYALASNFDVYQKQMTELDVMINSFLEKMPVDARVPETIEYITKVASEAGLVTSSIALRSAVDLDLYFELPIDIKVQGDFHDLGKFVAGLTQLKRLISLGDFSLQRAEDGDLTLTLSAKTFQFISEDLE